MAGDSWNYFGNISNKTHETSTKNIFACSCWSLVAGFFFLIRKPTGLADNAGDIKWGVAFSKMFATEMGLDWRETYLAILDDLRVKRIRLPIYWQDVEAEAGKIMISRIMIG